MSRNWLAVLVVIASIALVGFMAGCGSDKNATTTSGSASTSSTNSTASSTASSETGSTIVAGGKSLDEYKAEIPGLDAAVAADPQDLSSLEELGVAHYQLGEYDAAAEAYLKILAITDDAFIRNALGNVYRDQQKYDEAIAQYERAIALDPTLKHPYINEAGVWKLKGDLTKANEVLERAKAALNADDAKTAEGYQQMLTSTTTT
jgi:tetratricopeptide (TPR) repeat protein